MKDLSDLKEFEKSLLKHLDYGEMDKTSLKTVSAEIVNLKKNGLGVDQVEVLADRILINGIVNPEFFKRFNNLGRGFKRFEIFPYGIVNPEGFRFQSTMRL